jgi:hypothetical protein
MYAKDDRTPAQVWLGDAPRAKGHKKDRGEVRLKQLPTQHQFLIRRRG